MPPTTTKSPNFGDVIDAMRSVQTESDRWNLAEALHKVVPAGVKGFQEILDAAANAGVMGNLSIHTLRLYRDAAVRWPVSKRVKNVSFTAHREAMVLEDIDAAVKMLNDLVKTQGANKVTVASVRKAIAVKQGKPVPQKNAGRSAKQGPAIDVFADLRAGAPALIREIKPDTSVAVLDELHAGLTKAIAHVERLRAKKAAQKKAQKAAPAKVAAPAKPSNGKATAPVAKTTPKKPQGDLRDL